ncbi:hypothetical protein AAHE18_10G010600 [Arachis hypogaea]
MPPKNPTKQFNPQIYHGTIRGSSLHHPQFPLFVRARNSKENTYTETPIVTSNSKNSGQEGDNEAKKHICEEDDTHTETLIVTLDSKDSGQKGDNEAKKVLCEALKPPNKNVILSNSNIQIFCTTNYFK